MNKICKFLLWMMIIGLSSCASIPRETVEMSVLLGRQIEALEQGHTAMIEAFYKEKEVTATKWLKEQWYRNYLNDLFAMPSTIEFWNEAITEELPQRMESLKNLTDLIQEDYMQQRDSLLIPLKAEKEKLLGIIQTHYNMAREMNDVITKNIDSANTLEEKRKQLLSRFVNTDKIDMEINQSLQRADSILSMAQTALEKIDNKFK